jgi:acyl carrier protein phosphodiesterase
MMLSPETWLATLGPDGLEGALAAQKHSIRDGKRKLPALDQPVIPGDDHRHLFSHRLRTQQALNFLAHFHLARPTDGSRVGALLGDFVRGTPESLRDRLPSELVEGIVLHRAIDHFTDSHEIFLRTKKLLSPPRRRFAGIIVDIFFDHLLAQMWSEYSKVPLRKFIAEMYRTLERRDDWLTPEVSAIIGRMQKENWLGTYGTIPGLALTFRRVSQRRAFLAPLVGAEDDLTSHYQSFTTAFQSFYPEVISFAAGENPGGALSSP